MDRRNIISSVWQNYWFENTPAKLSLACIRIAVYICILQSLYMTWNITSPEVFLQGQNILWYSPVGILQLLGQTLPPVQFFIIIKYIALISALLSLFGLFTITSSCISFISNQLFFCLLYSWGQPWEHGFNIIFLAQLSILFSPAGDSISFDHLINRNKLISKPNGNYTWAIRLAQCTVALMFFNGFFYKWLSSPMSLGWAFSDNLRNTIVTQFVLENNPLPSYLLYIVNHPGIYKTIACLNLLSQFCILFACIFVRNPWIRLSAGVLAFLELLGFYFMMHLTSFEWYGLLAIFVDWDYFIARFKNVNNTVQSSSAKMILQHGRQNSISVFIACFLSFYILVGFYPWYGLQEILKPYPFTRHALYNQIDAQKPYSKHLPWPVNRFLFKVFIDSSYNSNASRFLNTHLYHMNASYYFTEKNKSNFLTSCKTTLQNGGFKHITSIALYKEYSEIPPYPHNPDLRLLAEALQYKMDTLNTKYIVTQKGIDSSTHQLSISIDFFGYDNSIVKFFIQPDLYHIPIPVEFERSGQKYLTELSVNNDYIRIEVYTTPVQTIPDVYYIEPG